MRVYVTPPTTTGVGGAREPDPVEYDLDNEDEDWLKTYNLGRNKLSDQLFEKMLWKLELACAEATDSALTAAGGAGSGGWWKWGLVGVGVGFDEGCSWLACWLGVAAGGQCLGGVP